MKRIDLGQTIAILANVGVIAGLLFVGYQLQQDRQIAIQNGLDMMASARQAWIENISANRDLWVRGLAGERLTEEELAVFNAMVSARENYYFSNWRRNQTIGSAADVSASRWVREAALDFSAHPGMMSYWLELNQRLNRTVGGPIEWTILVNEEIDRLNREPGE